ncbi:uncharacterized protein F4812DRAFT_454165 [Daldinia caldariorum]|uniref:uncharacterized protein n=1 Tax=Daldinia caldariorum TaxID=326644 RepID=UPI0020083A27|nr:uncharacterized protein F4812DRAFT_454165 [Daldinia caldariorum]KAI1472348.1 hypothetical protein F4812DRAFT_454165 [Daldinia caldariorum]
MSEAMDPRGRGIVDLNDKQHPNYALTRRNNSSKFLSIALEVRLMIYEYAVYIKEEISPIQLESRSNQFIFQKYISKPPYVSREPQPTVALLTRVCRTIYAEFEHFQPFYNVHTFSFMELDKLRTYIAAITPSRRRSIRRISYGPTEWFDDHILLRKEIYEECPQYPLDDGTLTILSQTGLEEFTLIKTIDEGDLFPGRTVAHELDAELKNVQTYPDRLHTIRNLPCFRLRFNFTFLCQTGIANELVKQIDEALEIRRQRIGIDKPEWFKQLNNFRLVENAMREVSGLDILGEDRVALDRAASCLGPVSSRTRNKCRLPNSIGQLVDNIPRYSADGILTSQICQVHDIRWDGTDVQCQVSVFPNIEDKVWEDISALLVPDSIEEIMWFYGKIMKENNSSRLDEIKGMPTLRNIIEVQRGFHFLQDTKEEICARKQRQRLRRLQPRAPWRREFTPRRSELSILRGVWMLHANEWETYIAKLERSALQDKEGSDSETPSEAEKGA